MEISQVVNKQSKHMCQICSQVIEYSKDTIYSHYKQHCLVSKLMFGLMSNNNEEKRDFLKFYFNDGKNVECLFCGKYILYMSKSSADELFQTKM